MTYETAMSTYKAYSQKNGAKWGEVAYVRPCLRNKGVVLGPCRTTLFIVYKGSWILQTRAIPYYLKDFYRFYPLFFQ